MENIETIDSVCTYCGVGCDIAANVDTKENKIVKIFAHPLRSFLKVSYVSKENMVLILSMLQTD